MTQRIYNTLPSIQQGIDISPDWGLWGLVVPEVATNLFPNPSWENATTALTGVTFNNSSGARVTTNASRGATSVRVTPSSSAASYMEYSIATATLGVVANTNYTWSLDIFVPGGGQMRLEARDSTNVLATYDFTAAGDWQRVSLPYVSLASGLNANQLFRLTRLSGSGLFYTDGWQLEQKSYPTTYVDGNVPGCYWVGGNDISQSVRPLGIRGGRYYNFRDFGLVNSGFAGAGLTSVDNISQPYGLLGGAFYQRTVLNERILNLHFRLNSKAGVDGLLKLRKLLEGWVSPDPTTQEGVPLLLAYQAGDCGVPKGRMITLPVYFHTGLEGNIFNPSVEDVTLQFVDFLNSGFKELFDQYANLPNVVIGPGGYLLIQRTTDGVFTVQTSISQYTALFYDLTRTLWYSNYATVTNGTTSQAVNSAVLAMAADANNNIYFGGGFTTPFNWVMSWNGTVFAAVGATINGIVRALAFDSYGYIWAGGDFLAPASRLARLSGGAWAAVGTGANGVVRGIAVGQDRFTYIVGDFTQLNGVSNVRVGRFNNATNAYGTAMGTGLTGGGATVNCVAISPSGLVYVGGDFTTAGGVAAQSIAVWNGTSWGALGANTLTGVVKSLTFDSKGDLIVAGSNLILTPYNPVTDPYSRGGLKWNGSNWLHTDVTGADTTVEFTVTASSRTGNNTAISVTPGAQATEYPSVIDVVNAGNTTVFPQLIIKTSSYPLLSIINYTTKKAIYFSYTPVNGETLTLNTDPKVGVSLVSNAFGDVSSAILPGSDIGQFGLVPGVNKIGALLASSGGNYLNYKNTYISIDGIVT